MANFKKLGLVYTNWEKKYNHPPPSQITNTIQECHEEFDKSPIDGGLAMFEGKGRESLKGHQL